jgi:rod shape determining protein RodA
VAGTEREFQLPIFNWVQRGGHGRFDPVSPACMLLLSGIGVFFIFSATIYGGHAERFPVHLKQIAWIVISAGAYWFVSHVDYKVFMKYSHWLWLGAVAGLVALFIPGIGVERLGATRWIDLGPVSVQPSEPAKLGVLVMCASILSRSRIGTVKESMWVLAKLALAAGLPILLILKQPDLGSALVIPPMVFSLLYAENLSRRFFTVLFVSCALIVSLVALDTYGYYRFLAENNISPSRSAREDLYAGQSWLPYLKDYQRNRILSFAAPEEIEPRGISWNLRQSLITVGSGGLFGKGWRQGTQARLGYLPPAVAHNDFISSVLAEETGFLGSITVLGLFGLLLANGVRVASLARDRFGILLALGVTIVFAVHVFVNIGMTIGLVPITGLPLPFLSYGGTFLLSCCILQGLVQSVYRFRRDF